MDPGSLVTFTSPTALHAGVSLLTVLFVLAVVLAVFGSNRNSGTPKENDDKPDDPWPGRSPEEAGHEADGNEEEDGE